MLQFCPTVVSANMATTMGGSSDEPCAFMCLPYDVRVLIYELALSRVDALDIIIFSSTANTKADTSGIPTASILNRSRLIPAILRLNKNINDESMPFLYARNTFTFARLAECRAFTDPRIPGRALISHIDLPRMAMSRPIDRWNSLHTFIPPNVTQLTIEVGTHSVPFPELCRSLCRGPEMHLKQVGSEPAVRWTHFKHTVTLRLHPTKHFECLDPGFYTACLSETQVILWQRLKKSIHAGHAAV